jgi:hypothetical protein
MPCPQRARVLRPIPKTIVWIRGSVVVGHPVGPHQVRPSSCTLLHVQRVVEILLRGCIEKLFGCRVDPQRLAIATIAAAVAPSGLMCQARSNISPVLIPLWVLAIILSARRERLFFAWTCRALPFSRRARASVSRHDIAVVTFFVHFVPKPVAALEPAEYIEAQRNLCAVPGHGIHA